MRPEVFLKLLKWLRINGGLRNIRLLSAVEKLLILLLVFSSNQLYWVRGIARKEISPSFLGKVSF